MRQYVKEKGKLSPEGRNLLSVAYKNVIGNRRTAWRIIYGKYTADDENKQRLEIATGYLDTIKNELQSICEEVVDLLDNCLLEGATDNTEYSVFYLKMKGDYCRYMCEVASGNDRAEIIEKTRKIYQEAQEVASSMVADHPVRLGLALNNSVFYFEIMNKPTEASKLAEEAIRDARSVLNSESTTYNDSSLIIQLLADNLILWTSEKDLDDEESDEDAIV